MTDSALPLMKKWLKDLPETVFDHNGIVPIEIKRCRRVPRAGRDDDLNSPEVEVEEVRHG